MDIPDPWPPSRLVVRTPRLELRPDDDAGLLELAALANRGVHPPERMPFTQPWTDADPEYLGRGTLQHYWRNRADVTPEHWWLHFLVRSDGRVIGTQSMGASDFAITREVHTGSWLGMAYQGQGYGTEMRAAVLTLAFDHLGAVAARSGAFTDNPASLEVSRKLGYREDGTATHAVRGKRVTEIRFLLSAEGFQTHRPDWRPEVTGLEPCLGLLGAG